MSGFYNHIWYKLLDIDGVPIPSASIWIYEFDNPTTEIILFDNNENQISQPISSDSNGVFEFYIKDNIRSSVNGYPWNTKFIISWSKDTESGIIKGDNLFGEFEVVSLSGSADTNLNKTLSDYIGWSIDNHVDFDFGTTHRCGSSSSSSSSSTSSS